LCDKGAGTRGAPQKRRRGRVIFASHSPLSGGQRNWFGVGKDGRARREGKRAAATRVKAGTSFQREGGIKRTREMGRETELLSLDFRDALRNILSTKGYYGRAWGGKRKGNLLNGTSGNTYY